MMVTENKRSSLDLAAILREHQQEFMNNHRLCPDQRKAFTAISCCRTAAMGAHADICQECGHQQVSYNSCRNRHCNKCQYTRQLVWVDKLESSLPVCRYFHVVFTIPSQLHRTFYINQRICYKQLFKASAEALQKVARNPAFLGAETGAMSVLHTWGQSLTYHPHIHMLVPAGGLSEDGMEWINAGKRFFLPVKVLSKVFRGVLWDILSEEIASGKVKLADDHSELDSLKAAVYSKNWNVYVKKPLAGPQSVVRYLGKYTHRVAISNSRLVSNEDGKVAFQWKDYRKRACKGLLTLEAGEFINRFMRHILPSGFYKIRYYGILATGNRKKREQCVRLIGKSRPPALLQGLNPSQVLKVVTGKDPSVCPQCEKGKLTPKVILVPD